MAAFNTNNMIDRNQFGNNISMDVVPILLNTPFNGNSYVNLQNNPRNLVRIVTKDPNTMNPFPWTTKLVPVSSAKSISWSGYLLNNNPSSSSIASLERYLLYNREDNTLVSPLFIDENKIRPIGT